MKCIVCCQNIKSGEQIFWGTQMVCCGPGENDCEYSGASEGLVGAMHISCLENPTAVVKTSNTVVSELVKKELIVIRSDALSIFDGTI